MSKTKYVLMERIEGDFPKMAASPETAADIERSRYAGTFTGVIRPITLREIRSERVRVYTDEEHAAHLEREEERAEWDIFRAQYHGKTFDATVDWFDRSSGRGMVTIHEGNLRLPLYACNIKGRKTWYTETACVYYEAGQHVQIEVDIASYATVFAKGVTEGTLDTEAWDRIKDQNLAFRCDESGRVINGLFE